MSATLSLTKLEFGSVFSYSPRGQSVSEKESQSMMMSIKTDPYFSNPPILVSKSISNFIKDKMSTLPFAQFFMTDPILVPVPSSSLSKPGTLRVPLRLALELLQNGIGSAVEDLLLRRDPLPKAATSQARDRPKAVEHYLSLEVQKRLSDPHHILLVDDIITRGATMLGAANRLRETFPGVHIFAFAAMRTMTPPFVFRDIYDPCIGEIALRGEHTFRAL
jgi:hypothetical protein